MNTGKKTLKDLELLLENAETREANALLAMQYANDDAAYEAAYNKMLEAQKDITYYDNEIRIARWTNSE